MRSTALLLVASAVVAALAAPLPFPKTPKPAAHDLKAMQGEWAVTRPSLARDAAAGNDMTLKVSGDRMTFMVGGDMRTSWAVTLDPSKEPRAMDLRRVAAKVGGGELTLLAVYRIEGDAMTFSYG